MTAANVDTVEQFDPAELDPLRRRANRDLMVAWINADLFNRAHLDVRKSVVLYDSDKLFEYALADVPDEHMLRQLRELTPVRYWAHGV